MPSLVVPNRVPDAPLRSRRSLSRLIAVLLLAGATVGLSGVVRADEAVTGAMACDDDRQTAQAACLDWALDLALEEVPFQGDWHNESFEAQRFNMGDRAPRFGAFRQRFGSAAYTPEHKAKILALNSAYVARHRHWSDGYLWGGAADFLYLELAAGLNGPVQRHLEERGRNVFFPWSIKAPLSDSAEVETEKFRPWFIANEKPMDGMEPVDPTESLPAFRQQVLAQVALCRAFPDNFAALALRAGYSPTLGAAPGDRQGGAENPDVRDEIRFLRHLHDTEVKPCWRYAETKGSTLYEDPGAALTAALTRILAGVGPYGYWPYLADAAEPELLVDPLLGQAMRAALQIRAEKGTRGFTGDQRDLLRRLRPLYLSQLVVDPARWNPLALILYLELILGIEGDIIIRIKSDGLQALRRADAAGGWWPVDRLPSTIGDLGTLRSAVLEKTALCLAKDTKLLRQRGYLTDRLKLEDRLGRDLQGTARYEFEFLAGQIEKLSTQCKPL